MSSQCEKKELEKFQEIVIEMCEKISQKFAELDLRITMLERRKLKEENVLSRSLP